MNREPRGFGWRILDRYGNPTEYQGHRDRPTGLGRRNYDAQKLDIYQAGDLESLDWFFTHPTDRDAHKLVMPWTPIVMPDTKDLRDQGVLITEAEIAIVCRRISPMYVPTDEFWRDERELTEHEVVAESVQEGDLLAVGGTRLRVKGAVVYDDYVDVHLDHGHPFTFNRGQSIAILRP